MTVGKFIVFLVLYLGSQIGIAAYAKEGEDHFSIVGDWQTVDHDTQKPSSIIHIWEAGGRYFGKIKKVYPGQSNPITRCETCQGWQHNHSILGLLILGDLVNTGNGYYQKGRILDPRSGKIYGCGVVLAKDGMLLKVRAHLRFSLIGVTDVWYRLPSTK